MTTAAWPPRSSDPAALLAAYTEVLEWPLVTVAGGAGGRVSAAEALRRLAADPDTVIGTRCAAAGVDAVVLPLEEGRKALVVLEAHSSLQPDTAPVPAIRTGDGVMLLVRAGTGGMLAGLENIRTVTETQLFPLPPTAGVVWDSPPWQPLRRMPAPFPSGEDLLPALKRALSPWVAPWPAAAPVSCSSKEML
ncbi:hypothetical protein ACFRI7_32075 [Streptomyces sp. NPDC056716]|uniref:hypothetical protein n=1 Tax=unclassified Streptomyces TaxID=2593676 RepID=UPI003698E2E8